MKSKLFQKLPKKISDQQLLGELFRAHLMIVLLAGALVVILLLTSMFTVQPSQAIAWITTGLLVLVMLASTGILLALTRYRKQ